MKFDVTIFRKYVEKIRVASKSGVFSWNFMWLFFDNMSRRFVLKQNMVDFHEILCDYFRKHVEKIRVASKSGVFSWNLMWLFRQYVEKIRVESKSGGFSRNFMWLFFENVEKIRAASKSGENKDLSTFMIISRSILLRTRNVPNKNCRENQNKFDVQ